MPLVLGAVSVAVALAFVYLLALASDVSIFALNIGTMIGLGLAIDFSLIMVSRFREELRDAPVETALEWPRLGAIPESFGTAWGSLDQVGLQAGGSLLVRGGSSSVGMAAITIAKDQGLTVFATTRQERKRAPLEAAGVDHVVIDDGSVAAKVRELAPEGVNGLLELVGPGAVLDSLTAVAPGGRACISGFLEGDWNVEPARAEAERLGIPLARFGSGTIDVDSYGEIFQGIVSRVEDGRYRDILDRTFPLAEIAEAHGYMEANRATGKVVGLPP